MGADHLEREFKLELAGEAERARLRAALPAAPVAGVLQTNHFLDTPAGGLRAARLALRLRAEGGRWYLTLKGPRLGNAGELTTRAEEELELDAAHADAILAGRVDPLAALPPSALRALAEAARQDGTLVLVGSFVNERERFGPLALGALPAGLVLELDRTHFPDGIAHELEVEVPDGIEPEALERELRLLFARLELPWRPAGNKAARFFRALGAHRARAQTQD